MPLTIYTNSDCNLDCRYCLNINKGKRLEFSKIKDLLAVGKRRGHKHLILTGGEPFIREDIIEIVDVAYNLGYWTTILTNGLLIDDGKIEKLANKRWKLQIRISLDGAEADTHQYFRGADTFASVLATIKKLVENRLVVGIGYTAYPENIKEISKITQLGIELKAAFLRVVPVVRINKAQEVSVGVGFYEQVLTNLIAAALKAKPKLDFNDDQPLFDIPIEVFANKQCMAGSQFFGIDPEGQILPCPLVRYDKEFLARQYTSEKDLDDVDQYMTGIFNSVENNLKGACQDCDLKAECVGGCLAEKISLAENINDEQPICVKRMLSKVLARFTRADVHWIKNYWYQIMQKNDDGSAPNKYCMRHLPIWTLDFRKNF